MFRDRAEAGRRLADRLLHLRGADPLVLALPRGGVPVALPIAEALGAPLDLLLVRKIGAPGNPEFGIGAVVEGEPPQTVVREETLRRLGIPAEYVREVAAEEIAGMERRRHLWRGGEAAASAQGRSVVLVDDGIATGGTVLAALAALRRLGARRLVVAAPVASPEGAAAVRAGCDEAVLLAEPAGFLSVGSFYADFRQLEDAEVTALLRRARDAAA